MSTRPDPVDVSDEATLRRWYWLRSELAAMARRLGVSASGGKSELTERLGDRLSDRTPAALPRPEKTHDRLPAVLTGDTPVERGQRCTQRLREWITARVGGSFHFDAVMRQAVTAGGVTLDELAELWHASRHRPPADIAPQFEFNRFAREWHAAHADGDRAAMLGDWRSHRATPRDPLI